MSDHDEQPTNITVTRSVLAFGTTTVVALVIMFAVMIYNANGGF